MGAEHVHRPADRARGKAESAGAPLPAPTAERMRAAFGQDFSEVRVHTGTAADRAARAVDAQAFTVGHDLVFGEGGFAPDTEHGERLLAHELGHVVEQRATGPRLARQPAGQPVAPPQADRRTYVESAIHFLRGAAEYYGLSGPPGPNGQPLVRVQPGAVPGRLKDFLRIRDDASTAITAVLGGDPALTADLRAAYRDTVRALLTAAAAATPGTSADGLYFQHQQLIHAWAWPEARLDPQRNTLLDTLPAQERARIRVTTDDLSIQGFATLLGPNPDLSPLPQNTTVTLAPNIPAARRTGLANVAQYLVTTTPVGAKRGTTFLGPNLTMTLRLDLGAQAGGRGTYRFTHVEHPAQRGVPARREVLVEHLADLGTQRDQGQPQPGGDELLARHHFVRDRATWTDPREIAQLLGALAVLPDGVLARIEGITFVRVRALPGRDAQYRTDKHTVEVADSAFRGRDDSLLAFQGPDQPTTGFQRLIAHELGHAYDWAALRAASATADRATLRDARGESGARFRAGKLTDALPRGDSSEFRTAAAQDGTTRITAYADRDWREFYAESFALYLADPETLQRLRPNLYRYFTTKLPAPGRQP